VSVLEGSPEQVLKRVQEIVEAHVPGVVCELQDYKTQIGCGILDDRGSLHEVKWRLRGLSKYNVEAQANALASHVLPRTGIIRRNAERR
jgi:hypothetical protein